MYALFLLTLFLTYQAGIWAFTHVHMVNGVQIVHSHPSTDKHHTHTAEQAITIAYLSVIRSLEADLPSTVLSEFPLLFVLEYQTETFRLKAPHTHCVYLRAPPSC